MFEPTDFGEPSPWQPMSDPVDLAHLGKLAEEVNELGAIVARCIIQGIDGKDPETDEPNCVGLAKEIADVKAMMAMAVERFALPLLPERTAGKIIMKEKWHRELER